MASSSQCKSTSDVDIKILMDFIHHPVEDDNFSAQITSLQTLASMCENGKVSQALMDSGGIKDILGLLMATKNIPLIESCVFLLACTAESNKTIQKYLCREKMFIMIKYALSSNELKSKTKAIYLFFLLSLVYRNSLGQKLLSCSRCLEDLLGIFLSGVSIITKVNEKAINNDLKLWDAATKVIIASTMQPQNEKNQRNCCRIFKSAATILHESKRNKDMIIQVCKLLSASVYNNKYCQNLAFMCQTLEVVILKLQEATTDAVFNVDIISSILELLNNLVPEQKEFCERFSKLGGLRLVLQTISKTEEQSSNGGCKFINQGLMLITKCATASSRCCDLLVEYGAPFTIVKLMKSIKGDSTFNNICTSILHLCLSKQTSTTESKNQEKDDDDNDDEDWFDFDDKKKTNGSDDDNEIIVNMNTDIQMKNSNMNKFSMQNDDNMSSISVSSHRSILHVLKQQSQQMAMLQTLVLKERKMRQIAEKKIDQVLEAQSNASECRSMCHSHVSCCNSAAKSTCSILQKIKRSSAELYPHNNGSSSSKSSYKKYYAKYSEDVSSPPSNSGVFKIPTKVPLKGLNRGHNEQVQTSSNEASIEDTNNGSANAKLDDSFNDSEILTSTMLSPNDTEKMDMLNSSLSKSNCFTMPDEGVQNMESLSVSNSLNKSGNVTLDLSHIMEISPDVITDEVSMVNTSSKTMFTPKTACTIIEAIGEEKVKNQNKFMSDSNEYDKMSSNSGVVNNNLSNKTDISMESSIQNNNTLNGSSSTTKYKHLQDPTKNFITDNKNKTSKSFYYSSSSENMASEISELKSIQKLKSHIRPREHKKNTNYCRKLPVRKDPPLTNTPTSTVDSDTGSKSPKRARSVYAFSSGCSKYHNAKILKATRRPKIPFSAQEVSHLLEGVRVLGRNWRDILVTYEFNNSRTAVDLKDKYRNIMRLKQMAQKANQ